MEAENDFFRRTVSVEEEGWMREGKGSEKTQTGTNKRKHRTKKQYQKL